MTKTTYFLKILKSSTVLLTLMLAFTVNAQVGIGTNTPASGALLDLTDANRGLLVPRVTIGNLATAAPVTAPTTGLLVWNLDLGTGVGFHYWSGSAWVPLGGAAVANAWNLTGNTITGTEVLGTLSNHDLNFVSNGLANTRMRVQATGEVTVGFAGAANVGDQFSSVGLAANGNGVSGYSGGTGIGVYGQNIGGGDALAGINNSTGNAIYGLNIGTGIGLYAENFLGNNYSIHAVDGFYSVYGDNNIGGDALVGDTNSTISNGVWGINTNTGGTAILGGTGGLHIYPTTGTGVSGSGPVLGVYGYAGEGDDTVANEGNAAGSFTLDSDSNVNTTAASTGTRASALLAGYDNVTPDGVLSSDEVYFGGYFTGGTAGISYAYAGIKYNPSNASGGGGGGTNYKIIGNGTNSTIIRDRNNVPRILFSPEAPEILFEDYGTGKLINGIAQINIDPILKDAIHVDENHPLKVFIQLEGDCNGVYVTNKSANGFTVKELQGGNSNVEFSWHIVANRADEYDENGEIASEHVGLRFPIGPGPVKPKPLTSKKINTDLTNIPQNQKSSTKSKIFNLSNSDNSNSDNDKEKQGVSKKIKLKNK